MGIPGKSSGALLLRIPVPFDLSDHATHDGRESKNALRGRARTFIVPGCDQYRDDVRSDADRGASAPAGQLWRILVRDDVYRPRACSERLSRAVDLLEAFAIRGFYRYNDLRIGVP